uniref:Venom phosphodiesterase 1-like n=1 Tax=Seriola dumerili TaxID=41447 RepID=A0A3B4UI61_SERDU
HDCGRLVNKHVKKVWSLPVIPHTSCRNRCYEPYDDEIPGCRCDESCIASSSCCNDYHDICTILRSEQWDCTKLRCGEKRLMQSRCHCSDDCLSAGDCCTNYKNVCHGEDKEWVEDECEDLSSPTCPAGFKQQPLLLISLDGLRAEYMQTWSTLIPVLDKLKTCGTSAPYMQAAFPSKTFPNHYAIVTGLYPESNGLIDNTMYDPVFDATFSLSSPEKDNPDWYLGQPVSLLSNKSSNPYNKVPFEERVFTVLKWLQLPDEERLVPLRLNLGKVTQNSLQGVDKIIGQLMNGLKQIGLHRCLNIIIVADHGMEDTSCNRKEVLQELVGDISNYYVTEGPFGRIRAKNKDKSFPVFLLMIQCKKPDQKIKPYLKANLPKRLHFANSRRIEDVNILVDPKWLFERTPLCPCRYPGSLTFCSGGAHGYDNDAESMHAMFVSYGPKFKSKTAIEPFSNVELYNLMCDLLKISPSDNNGTHGSMNHVLKQAYYTPVPPAEQSVPALCQLVSLEPADSLGCSCLALVGIILLKYKSIKAYRSKNDLCTNVNIYTFPLSESATEKKHVLFGRPRMLQPDQSYCILYQEGFISGYSSKALMPLWSSFTVDKPVNVKNIQFQYWKLTPDCLRADVRLPASKSPRCNQYDTAGNLTHAFLYPPSMYQHPNDTKLKIWYYFHNTLLKKYASVYNGINVVIGPVFDYNYDGHYDTPEQIQFVSGTNISIPTHYFAVLTSCRDSAQSVTTCMGELQTVSFLLPHRPNNSESCKSTGDESYWVEDHMWFHQSRVRDVEWITGLDFYQGSNRPIPELLRVKPLLEMYFYTYLSD